MKIFKSFKFNIIAIFLAILNCMSFFAPMKNLNKSFAAESKEITNISALQVISSTNTSRVINKSLVKKGTDDFYDGYIYSSKTENEQLQTMSLNISEVEFSENQSLYVWVFIPSVIFGDLVISATDLDSNSISWEMRGSEISENTGYKFLLSDMVSSYAGKITRGWKLLQLSFSDAEIIGEINSISKISISYFQSALDGNSEESFAITYPFVADKYNAETSVVSHQDYVVYSQKQDFLNQTQNIYVGDKLTIRTAKEIFGYVIVGMQNILDNASGYLWSAFLTKPSGGSQTFTLDRQIEIDAQEEGYYLFEINLTTSTQDSYSLVSESINIFVEEFSFGYFQKKDYAFELNSENMVVFTLSDDFVLDETQALQIVVNDKNIADATYYEEDSKIYIKVSAKTIGETTLKVSAFGTRVNQSDILGYETEISISVNEVKKDSNMAALWVIFGILMAGFVVYLVISFVKSRRFGVK